MSNPDEMMNILKKNCDLNCERCRRAIESLNKLWIIIFGIPFTEEHCPLELFDKARKAEHEAEALRLEMKAFLKKMKTEIKTEG
jgi:hypothetical protein